VLRFRVRGVGFRIGVRDRGGWGVTIRDELGLGFVYLFFCKVIVNTSGAAAIGGIKGALCSGGGGG
jgi:hypothetical protein